MLETWSGSSDGWETRRPELSCRWARSARASSRLISTRKLSADGLMLLIIVGACLRNHGNCGLAQLVENGYQLRCSLVGGLELDQPHRLFVERDTGGCGPLRSRLSQQLLL